LVKLICRIYDPTEGRILINGFDLKNLSTKEWWSYLSVMFQDYASYDFLVKEAIAIGRSEKEINLTKVVEAGKTSQAHDFIMDWDKKYDEQLGVEFKGKEPSKGQRQKLSIAKTLYRDGLVMILDEPTASVDAESESKIFDSIESLSKERTAILISHDFSTISACDEIFVLDKGKLIEEGDHHELMKKKGLYSELYNLQAKRFKK
jgi:ABC-type multidrug transport system fused ATPase/permease subunit